MVAQIDEITKELKDTVEFERHEYANLVSAFFGLVSCNTVEVATCIKFNTGRGCAIPGALELSLIGSVHVGNVRMKQNIKGPCRCCSNQIS